MSTYDVRVHGILANKNTKSSTYTVRWVVAGKAFRDTFVTKALAESFRSDLVVAQRKGVAFDEPSGLPEPMAREKNSRTWYEHAIEFIDMKWPRSSARHRRSIAEALTDATLALIISDQGRPEEKAIRQALYGWAFNKTRRESEPPPQHLSAALTWVKANTPKLADLDTNSLLVRRVLNAFATLRDGKEAAANTFARKRTVFSGALSFAVELHQLEHHPLQRVKWTAPKGSDEVDRAVVVNPNQARALLAAVRELAPELEAFFGCMYYAALRPEEALHLRADHYKRPQNPGGWGRLHLTGATVTTAGGWSDTNTTVEDRSLKHRDRNATRSVPVSPPLCGLLDMHLTEYQVGRDERLFVTRRGPGGRLIAGKPRPVPNNAYTTVWRKAREKALTPDQRRSLLARRPYDLRHAAVSTWLNAGVPASQIAEWAGHSIHVLLKVYAKCIDGQETRFQRLIDDALASESATDQDTVEHGDKKDPEETSE